jgi:MFS family permease
LQRFRHPVFRIALATTLLVAAYAMYAPVLAVLLQQRGHGTAAVGAFAMLGFACTGALIPVMPKVLARLGEVRACQIGMAMQFAATLGYAFSESLWLWCACSVLGGLGSAAVWNGTEALLARYAPAGLRGRIMGVYQTALGGAMALGPFAPGLLGMNAHQTLIAASVVQCVGSLVAMLTQLPASISSNSLGQPTHRRAALSTWGALRRVPALAVIAFAGGVFEAGLGSVSAANGAAIGLSLAAAASIVGALGTGSFLFQYPAGMIADRVAPQRVFAAAGILLLISSISMGWSAQVPWLLWGCAFVWGGVGGALYTLTIIRVAHQFEGQDTAAGTAAMIIGYTLGGSVGPLISGAALQNFSSPGLSVWLSVLAALVIAMSGRVTQVSRRL